MITNLTICQKIKEFEKKLKFYFYIGAFNIVFLNCCIGHHKKNMINEESKRITTLVQANSGDIKYKNPNYYCTSIKSIKIIISAVFLSYFCLWMTFFDKETLTIGKKLNYIKTQNKEIFIESLYEKNNSQIYDCEILNQKRNDTINKKDNIVLISGTGRSGSTLIQRILNTIPNSNICGENWGAVNDLLNFYINIKRTSNERLPYRREKFISYNYSYLINHNIKPSWYNSYNLDEVKLSIKEMIRKLFKNNPETTLWGFKEIRYDKGKINLIKQFKELFPQTKVVIQVRKDIINQSLSGFWTRKRKEPAIKSISNLNAELENFYQEHKEYAYYLTLRDIFNISKIKQVFEFINYLDFFNEEKYNNIINTRFDDYKK